MQHGRPAQFRRRRQAVAVQLADAPRVSVNLLAGCGKPLDRELLKSFAEPIEPRRSAGIFEWKDQINALLRSCLRGRWRVAGGLLRGPA